MKDRMNFEVWMRCQNGDKISTKIAEVTDAGAAFTATLEKYNLRIEDVRELRVKWVTL